MDHAKSLVPPSTPSMMNMLPATEKGSRFVGICMHMRTPVVPCMYASLSMMCEPCAGALWKQSVQWATALGPILLDGARHLPILQRICMFVKLAENQCSQPSCTLVLHDIWRPYLDSLSGSLHGFQPQGFFFIVPWWAQYFPMWRTAFELGDAEFPLSAKKKTEKGLCYVGPGGRQLGGISF